MQDHNFYSNNLGSQTTKNYSGKRPIANSTSNQTGTRFDDFSMADKQPVIQLLLLIYLNVVSTANLNCMLELEKIAMNCRNAEYNPKRFAAVIMRLKDPKTTALVFKSGKIVCTGAKSPEFSATAIRKFARMIQKQGFKVEFRDFKVQNIVCSCDVKFQIYLSKIQQKHQNSCTFEVDVFPGLIYKMADPKMVLLIFTSGKLVLTGAKTTQDVDRAFQKIYPILKSFKKDDTLSTLKK